MSGMVGGTDKARILVVDDEPDMLDFIERVTRRRFDVTRCANGEDALALLADRAFDVLITDHKMPRMTGLELLERLGDRHPAMVRVLLSGYTDVPEVHRAGASGRVHHYVLKPVDSKALLAGIDHAYKVRDGEIPFANDD
jgi:response regulator RpfG family c-di-GMP phosphodiesterase